MQFIADRLKEGYTKADIKKAVEKGFTESGI